MKLQLSLLGILASLMLSVKADFPSGFLFGKPATQSSMTTSTDRFHFQSQETTIAAELNTSSTFSPTIPPAEDAHINRFGHGGLNKRDVRGQLFPVPSTSAPSTIRPGNEPITRSTSTAVPPVHPTISIFHSHHVGQPVEADNKRTTTAHPASSSTSTPFPAIPNRHRRELPEVTVASLPTAFTESTERDSRFFFTFPTRNPADSDTTRRTLFNRNRRQTLFPSGVNDDTPTTRRFSLFDNRQTTAPPTTSTTIRFPMFFGHGVGEPQIKKVSTTAESVDNEQGTTEDAESTTRRFGFQRFRRSVHEFLPEEEELGQTNPPTTTTRKPFPGRVRRDEDDKKDEIDEIFRITMPTTEKDVFFRRTLPTSENDEFFRRTSSTNENDGFFRKTSTTIENGVPTTSTVRNRPFVFNFGQSSEELPSQSSTTTTTERIMIGSGRFRRSDNFGSESFTSHPTVTTTPKPTTSAPVTSQSSSTKEPTTSTRHPAGHFHI